MNDTPFELPPFPEPSIPSYRVDIRDHGAVDDGSTMNTPAFAAAIEACAGAGGGTVVVPAGLWLTGPIHLRNHVELHLEKEAVVRFSSRPADYLPAVFTRWEGHECYNYSPLIYANGCNDIAVTGEGTFEGQGQPWWHWKKIQLAEMVYDAEYDGVPVEQRVYGTEEHALRPNFIQPINCRNVLIQGVTFRDGPMWTVHPVYSENVIVRGISIDTNGPNNDGCNPDSCRNVLIEHCRFSTGDDCIAINSGMNEDGRRVGRPCENIVIRHCHFERGHGGVTIGSGMSGGVRNVYAHDCDCNGTDVGIRLKSMRGRGGFVEKVIVERLDMLHVRYEPIRINMYYGATSAEPKAKDPPEFRDICIRDIRCRGAEHALLLRGLPEVPLRDVRLENIDIEAGEAPIIEDVEGLHLSNVRLMIHKGQDASS
ncbi:MAG: glycoside hydrolase [Phycisphaeraceae bacterium]|nr:glycoside hydrolase [Phycisphaeraceae bacterium]